MAESFLCDHPGLRPFVLSDVQLTGTRIGRGAYGRVDEVAFPVAAAANTVYAFSLQNRTGHNFLYNLLHMSCKSEVKAQESVQYMVPCSISRNVIIFRREKAGKVQKLQTVLYQEI